MILTPFTALFVHIPTYTKTLGKTGIPVISRALSLVEAAGIEPASEKPLTELSPGAGHLLNFPGLAADARAA